MNAVKSFLKSFFTEHLMGKFIAVFFASVTVFLIDRDIASTTVWENKRITVLRASEDISSSAEDVRILVETDRRVWIDGLPPDVPMKVSGPKNLEEEFRRDPVIRVFVRQEQVPTNDPGQNAPEILLNESNFSTKFAGVTALPLGDFKVKVDEIITVDNVPVELAVLDNLPQGRVVDEEKCRLEPATVSIIGPRHLVLNYKANAKLKVEPRTRDTLQDGKTYPLRIDPEVGASRWVKFANSEETPRVFLALKQAKPASLELGTMKIFWALTEAVRKQLIEKQVMLNVTLNFKDVQVTLFGPEDLIESLRSAGKINALRQSIRVFADPNKQISDNLSGQKDFDLPLEAIGVPRGLTYKLFPIQVHVTIRRKSPDNK